MIGDEYGILGIIQARMGSTRLPGKVLAKIGDLSMLEIIYRRLEKSETLDKMFEKSCA